MTALNQSNPKIVVIGMGPCGLGAAWRMQELSHQNYQIFEASSQPGGLASSFIDENGFTWDVGGHVQFSHYSYFDRVMDFVMKDEWIYHERSSWIWIKERFVPYPFQNNIRRLPREDMWNCLAGLFDRKEQKEVTPSNFKEWLLFSFGKGLADLFMFPYNFKVWAFPLENLTYSWIGDRVASVDLKRIIDNIIFEKDDISWGPNNQFRYPLKGGTGEIWKRLFAHLDPQKAFFGSRITKLCTAEKCVEFENGARESYDALISSIPLDQLVTISDLPDKSPVSKLEHSSTHIFGIGLRGKPPATLEGKCWMYFPESNCPFYRVTVFSHYSPNNVPDINHYWSLMAEVSESAHKAVEHATVAKDVIRGMLNTHLIESKNQVVSLWHHYAPYGYPTPTLKRDEALTVLRAFEDRSVFSRGRFGAWKYEVSNQDHSFMQGVEAVNKILKGEDELTVCHPNEANRGGR